MKKEVIHHHFDCIDSTNTWLKNHSTELKPSELIVVTAREQKAGRGRQGRSWLSPKDVNLYLSFGFIWEGDWTLLPMVASISTAQVLEDLGFSPLLKWPNDILINEKKVGGILCEASGPKAIVGIGLNVNMDQSQLDLIDQPATSMMVEKGQEFGLQPLTESITKRFLANLEINPIHSYKKRLIHQDGDLITFNDGTSTIKGRFRGINEMGFLKLEKLDGSTAVFSTGNLG